MARLRGRPSKAESKRLAAREPLDARRALELRVQGFTIYAISQALDMSPQRVNMIIDKYVKQEIVPYVDDYRTLYGERYEMMWQKLVASKRLDKGDPQAIAAGDKILKSLRDLRGVDAPKQLDVNHHIDPKEIELRNLILDARREARGEIAAIKGEVVEDEDEEAEDDSE